MKNKIFILLQIISFIAVLAVVVYASSAGTVEDPVVTKSYVDKSISDAVNNAAGNKADKLSDEDIEKIAQKAASLMSADSDEQQSAEKSGFENSSLTYKAVELKANKIMIGDEGSEMILRSGTAYIYITGIDSVLDVTTGRSLIDKNPVSIDHLIVIPRGDGRGIRATENAWVLIKGGYNIQDYSA